MQVRFREGRVRDVEIGTNVIGSKHIRSDAIGSRHLADDSVFHVALADDSVGSLEIIDNSIGYGELTSGLQGSLGGVAGPDSIGTTELKEPSVGSSQLFGDSVGSQHIIDANIKSVAIASNQIGYGHLTSGLQGTYMPKSGGTFTGSVDYSGAGKPPRLAILTPGGAITPVTLPAICTAVHGNFSWYELRYPPDSSCNACWEFQTPEYYDGGTVDFNIFWKAKVAANAGSVYWNIMTLGRTTNETWDTVMQNLGSLLATSLGSAKVNKTTISSKPDFTSDELAVVKIIRAGALMQDTLAGSAALLMVGIDYKAKK